MRQKQRRKRIYNSFLQCNGKSSCRSRRTSTNGKDQAAIDAKAKDLNDAVAALVERGNTDALKALIAEYKAEGLKEADYTTDSWKAYTDALTAAEKVVKDNSNLDQAAVDGGRKR